MKNVKKTIEVELQRLSIKIFQENNDTKSSDELGISNGKEIINEYIKYDEIGLAFKHLIYVVESVEFKLTIEQKEKFENIEKALKIDVPNWIEKDANANGK